MPLKCIIAILMHSIFVYLLEPPLLYRVYYFPVHRNPFGGMSRLARIHDY